MTLFEYFQQIVPSTGIIEIDVMMFFITFLITYLSILGFIGIITKWR